MKKKTSAGFTLLELVLVILILGILGTAGSVMLAQGIETYYTSQGSSQADWQGRLALERMARDIRTVRSAADITTASASQFQFTDVNNNSVNYTLSGTNLNRGSDVLAEGVSTLTFTYWDNNALVTAVLANIRYVGIQLGITQGGVNYTVRTVVELRELG